jgi:putative PIN family toxin of toxin-antitoxin system
MRIVLDTNILVRANAKARGPARELVQLITGSPEHTLLLSPFLLQELERVFSYERVRAMSKLTEEEIAQYLSYLRAKDVSEVVFPGAAPRVIASDPDDDPVVHTAVVGRADALCTLNRPRSSAAREPFRARRHFALLVAPLLDSRNESVGIGRPEA